MKMKQKRAALVGLAGFVTLIVWLAPRVPQLSVMENPISAKNALVDESEEASAPFPSHDIVGVFLDLGETQPTTADLERYVDMRKAFDQHSYLRNFRDYRLSLDTADFIRYRGEVLVKTPYLESGMSGKQFVARINGAEEPGVEGDTTMRSLLYNPELNKLVIIWQPPKGFDQAKFVWSIREVLCERSFSYMERVFLLTDPMPTPANSGWYPFGWPSGRQQIQDGMPKETSNYSVPGLIISFFILWASTGSLGFAATGVSMLLLMIFGVRSSIAVLSQFFLMAERPYIVLSYSNTLIQGQSLLLYASFIMREKNQDEKSMMRRIMAFVVLTSLGNMGAVWWGFGVRPIEEMAIESLVGLGFAYVAARWVLPVVIAELPPMEERDHWRVAQLTQELVRIVVGRPRVSVAIVMFTVAGVIGPVAFNHMKLGSNPLDFFHGTRVWQGFMLLQSSGLGADGIYARIGCRGGGQDFLDPHCLDEARKLAAELEAHPTNVKVGGVMPTIERLSVGEYGSPVPPTRKEAGYVWDDLEDSSLPLKIRENLYTPDHRYMHWVVMQKETGTSETTDVTMQVIKEAASHYPDLEVLRGGPSALFAETDRLIRDGELRVIMGQITSNWFWYMLLVWLTLRKRQRQNSVRVSSFRASLVASTPFVFATGGTVGVMYIAGIPFDLATAATLAMANSATNDFTMYYLGRWVERVGERGSAEEATASTLKDKGEQVITDCVMNMFTFMPLLLSGYGPIREVGWLVPVMLCLCGLGLFRIMVPLLPWVVVKKK